VKRLKRKPEPLGDSTDDPVGNARKAAVRLLARREHSARELQAKLTARGIEPDAALEAVADLGREGLQSDARFAEMYVRSRAERGYGPVRIGAELGERGVGDELIRAHLDEAGYDWRARAEQVRRKRFGARLPQDWRERSRQARFLQYRGFGAEHLRGLLDGRAES
jgi:regulatory protein